MDETWEMNIHLNPIDHETQQILKRHKMLLRDNIDDFANFINLTEKARRKGIKDQIRLEKLADFVHAEDKKDEEGSRARSRGTRGKSRNARKAATGPR
jgi:hypothetical protein